MDKVYLLEGRGFGEDGNDDAYGTIGIYASLNAAIDGQKSWEKRMGLVTWEPEDDEEAEAINTWFRIREMDLLY
jgi:hypothetical protein